MIWRIFQAKWYIFSSSLQITWFYQFILKQKRCEYRKQIIFPLAGNISFLHVVIVSSKWKFFRGIVITFPAVFYIFLGIFSARMHKISHEAKPSEKFYAWRLRIAKKNVENSWKSNDNSKVKLELARQHYHM